MLACAVLIAGASIGWTQITGNGSGAGQNGQNGQSKGKKLGSRDGSGPVHTPGTGGGTGAGQRHGHGSKHNSESSEYTMNMLNVRSLDRCGPGCNLRHLVPGDGAEASAGPQEHPA